MTLAYKIKIPPDRRGLFHDKDIKALKKFRDILDETFKVNLAKRKKVRSSNYRLNHNKFSPVNILDDDNSTYWATDDDVLKSTLWIDLESEVLFDRIMIQEPIRFGQRISEFSVECNVNKEWITIAQGTTIGYKRLLRVQPVKASSVKLTITKSNNIAAISSFGLYKASKEEMNKLD